MKRSVPQDAEQQQQQQQQRQQQQQHERPKTAADVARSTGLFRDYLSGLDNMRRLVNDCENQLAKALNEFYGTGDKDEQLFNEYLAAVSDAFEAANRCLDAAGHSPVIVDGQAPIAELVNKLKATKEPVDVARILQFWENFKLVVEQVQIISDEFERRVASKLKTSCLLASGGEQKSELTAAYHREAAGYAKEVEQLRARVRLLIHSAGTHVKLELLAKSSHADRVLLNCNDDFYPILCVVPDLTVKLEAMARVAYQWLDRDETYLFDVSRQLRQRRSETRDMEQELRQQRERHRQLLKSVKSAFLMCQNSRKRLREINQELQSLEEQMQTSSKERRSKIDEKKQKKEMVDFLNISISQTKMNYALQLKRQRLQSQIQELEEFLRKVEQQISELKAEIQTKSSERQTAELQSQSQESNFGSMKQDLESYTKKVQQMSSELRSVRQHLSHLETVQTLKTSPEVVDGFYDQQRSVKLAPSLMESINLKRRRVKPGK